MHDIKAIRDDPTAFDAALARRGLRPESARLLALDEARRAPLARLEALRERRNAASKEIGAAKARKDEAAAKALMAEVAALKEEIPTLEREVATAEKALHDALAVIPNLPAPDVPDGKDESANVERHRVGAPRAFNYAPKQHFELGEALGLMDFETAASISGARFVVLKGALARLERALGMFMLDMHTGEHGYTETNPPLLVKEHTAYGTGNLPKFETDLFHARYNLALDPEEYEVRASDTPGVPDLNFRGPRAQELLRKWRRQYNLNEPRVGSDGKILGMEPIVENDFYLTPTAEVSVTNYVRERIVNEAELPLRYTAWTPCFRSEAGAAGRDTRGMIRLHQFMKVELVSIVEPEKSEAEHERMLNAAEAVLRRLELPFRTVTLSTGDMGFAARKTYDIEVWLPGQGAYREISSCSNCGDFQARRMNARYRPADGKGTRFVHTLNGSGVAVGRCLVAVLENHQEADGSIRIPEALQPYMGGSSRIERA